MSCKGSADLFAGFFPKLAQPERVEMKRDGIIQGDVKLPSLAEGFRELLELSVEGFQCFSARIVFDKSYRRTNSADGNAEIMNLFLRGSASRLLKLIFEPELEGHQTAQIGFMIS